MSSALVTYSKMIKFSHTIFALPFALVAVGLAGLQVEVTGWQFLLILVAMVSARSSAMGFNRLVDSSIDAANPRTANRELVTGEISRRHGWIFTMISAALFVLASGLLSRLTLYLSPVALIVIWGYSLTKRFTALSHLFLGLALALAPVAVWIALVGKIEQTPLLLALAVGSWVAGFDILYSCQDTDFDASEGLHSIPVKLGLMRAMVVSALLHVVTVLALSALTLVQPLHGIYWCGVAAITVVLVWEHAIVKPTDLSRINKAFFDLNGYVSILLLAAVVADLWI